MASLPSSAAQGELPGERNDDANTPSNTTAPEDAAGVSGDNGNVAQGDDEDAVLDSANKAENPQDEATVEEPGVLLPTSTTSTTTDQPKGEAASRHHRDGDEALSLSAGAGDGMTGILVEDEQSSREYPWSEAGTTARQRDDHVDTVETDLGRASPSSSSSSHDEEEPDVCLTVKESTCCNVSDEIAADEDESNVATATTAAASFDMENAHGLTVAKEEGDSIDNEQNNKNKPDEEIRDSLPADSSALELPAPVDERKSSTSMNNRDDKKKPREESSATADTNLQKLAPAVHKGESATSNEGGKEKLNETTAASSASPMEHASESPLAMKGGNFNEEDITKPNAAIKSAMELLDTNERRHIKDNDTPIEEAQSTTMKSARKSFGTGRGQSIDKGDDKPNEEIIRSCDAERSPTMVDSEILEHSAGPDVSKRISSDGAVRKEIDTSPSLEALSTNIDRPCHETDDDGSSQVSRRAADSNESGVEKASSAPTAKKDIFLSLVKEEKASMADPIPVDKKSTEGADAVNTKRIGADTKEEEREGTLETSVLADEAGPSSLIAGASATMDVKAFLDVFVPLAQNTQESTSARGIEWSNADSIGIGVLSLSSVENWIKRLLCANLGLTRGTSVYKLFFPAYTRAFQAASKVPGTKSPESVDRTDFRILIAHLCVYALAFDAFKVIDSTGALSNDSSHNDQRLHRTQWMSSAHKVYQHGFVALSKLSDPVGTDAALEELFDKIQKHGQSSILFTDWCNFLQCSEMASATFMGSLLAYDRRQKSNVVPEEQLASPVLDVTATELDQHQTISSQSLESGSKYAHVIAGHGASSDAKSFLDLLLPLAYTNAESAAAREAEWAVADTIGNNVLSLSEVEKWVKHRLCSHLDLKRGMFLFKAFFPVYSRAFHASRDVPEALSPDDVGHSEFRRLISFICVYALAFDAFTTIDIGTATLDELDQRDQRISRREWLARCRRVSDHGFYALQNAAGESVSDESLGDVFDIMDGSGKGTIHLSEWCKFLAKVESDFGTDIGVFISHEGWSGETKVPSPTGSTRIRTSAGFRGGHAIPESWSSYLHIITEASTRRKRVLAASSLTDKDRGNNGSILTVQTVKSGKLSQLSTIGARPSSKIAGESATANIKTFLDIFLPPIMEKNEQIEWPMKPFTLDDLEKWIERRLCLNLDEAKSAELYQLYIPIYSRAYEASQDTHPATLSDNYAARCFLSHVCVYALALDAFDVLNAGNKRDDNPEMSWTEFLSVQNVSQHGFKVLADAGKKASADEHEESALEDIFDRMHDGSKNTVRLTEWCHYLSQVEVDEGTLMGTLLGRKKSGKEPEGDLLAKGQTLVDAFRPNESRISPRSAAESIDQPGCCCPA